MAGRLSKCSPWNIFGYGRKAERRARCNDDERGIKNRGKTECFTVQMVSAAGNCVCSNRNCRGTGEIISPGCQVSVDFGGYLGLPGTVGCGLI